MTPEKAKAKADALLIAGDALSVEFPANSRELLRLCRYWRRRASDLREQQANKNKGEQP